MRGGALVIKLRHSVVLIHVVVHLECLTLSSHNNIIGAVWIHFNLCIEQDTHKEAILVAVIRIEHVLLQVFNHDSLCFTLIIDQFNRSQ